MRYSVASDPFSFIIICASFAYNQLSPLSIRFFFLSFYIFGVWIVNNLVIALVIGYFLEEIESKDEEEEIDDVFFSGRQLVFDSDELPTSKKFGKVVARLNPKYRLTASSSKKVLKKLFSARVRGHNT